MQATDLFGSVGLIFVQLLVELEHLCDDFLVYFCRFNNVCPWK